jgi:uncharacterized membrane-anchored protein
MKSWAKVTLLIQLAFFTAWGAFEGFKLSRGRELHGEFLLETLPVDPRDYLSGQYMALNFAISDASRYLDSASDPNQSAAVLLAPSGKVALEGKEYPVYGSRRAVRPAPSIRLDADPGQIWVIAQRGATHRLQFGIERYFFNENRKDEMEKMRGGQFYAKVTAAPDGSLKLISLEKK